MCLFTVILAPQSLLRIDFARSLPVCAVRGEYGSSCEHREKRTPRKHKGRTGRPLHHDTIQVGGSALTRLEARIALADHEDFAAATDDFAIAMTLLGRFE
jgi:hypothetical protein